MTTLSLILADWLVALGLIISLNFIVGKTGAWSIGHLAYYAIAQLVLGCTVTIWEWPIGISCLFAVVISIAIAAMIGAITLRLRSDYFIIASIAVSTLVQGASVSLLGPRGVSGISHIFKETILVQYEWLYLGSTLGVTVIVLMSLVFGYTKSPLERVSAAIRSSEQIAESFAIASFRLKLTVFTIGSGAAAVIGCLTATFYGMTDPADTTLYRGILLFAIMLLGGIDSIGGSVVASVILVMLPRIIEYVIGTPEASFYAGKLSQLLLGATILIMIRAMPYGVIGNRRWTER